MFCPKCGNEVADGTAFCGKCGAPVAAPAGGAAHGAGSAGSSPKKGGAKVGVIAAAVVVVVVLVAGFATNWFGMGGVQPKEAVEVPAASQGGGAEAQGEAQGGDAQDGSGDAQGAAGASVKSAVEAYSWDELSQISAEIAKASDEAAAVEVAKKYNLVGADGKLDGTQVKSVTLTDGTQTTVQIAGFAHDDKTAGGKAGITFVFGDAIAVAPMNPSDTNAGGWEASQMRAYLSSAGMALLPEDMRAAIAPVDKLTNNVGETQDVSSVTTTSDSLWLFSFAELAGPIPAAELWGGGYEWAAAIFNAEGSRYKLFEDTGVNWGNNNSILVKNYQGSSCIWWGRSANPSSSDCFQFVYPDGGPYDRNDASYSVGVVPGFCL